VIFGIKRVRDEKRRYSRINNNKLQHLGRKDQISGPEALGACHTLLILAEFVSLGAWEYPFQIQLSVPFCPPTASAYGCARNPRHSAIPATLYFVWPHHTKGMFILVLHLLGYLDDH
jgi:hypothetical protein